MMMRDEEGRLQCPFGLDFASYTAAAASSQKEMEALARVPWWLALIELEKLGHSFGEDDASALPYRFEGVVRRIRSSRQDGSARTASSILGTSDDLANALIGSPRFHHKLSGHDLFLYALRSKGQSLPTLASKDASTKVMKTSSSLMPERMAKEMAEKFVEFVVSWELREEVAAMSAEQVVVLALFHKHMRSRPVARLMASERFDLVRSKPEYVPAALVHSPAKAHFAIIADSAGGESAEKMSASEHKQWLGALEHGR